MRHQPEDFTNQRDWEEYASEYWRLEQEYTESIMDLSALVEEEKAELLAWVMDGEKPRAAILEPILRGDLLDWVRNMGGDSLAKENRHDGLALACDIKSIAELFSWFENKAPGKCWGNPIDYRNWRGAV